MDSRHVYALVTSSPKPSPRWKQRTSGRRRGKDTPYSGKVLPQVTWHGRNVAVPLSQLTPLDADESTSEAVSDWHYWIAQGYLF
jgi:hypothetical protein